MALAPGIAAQVDYLLRHSPLPIEVDGFQKGHESYTISDRFCIHIPCFLDSVKWEVVYNHQNPYWPPDVIFGANDSGFEPLTNKTICGILKDWNAKDPSRLFRLIVELRGEYLRYQRKRVKEINDSRLHFEFDTMNDVEGLEMGLISEADNASQVIFSIPLNGVDLSKLTEPCGISLEHGFLLQVKFPIRREYIPSPLVKLHTPNTLKDVFSVEDIRLPAWSDNMCLMEYIPKLQAILESQVYDAKLSLSLRRKFIEALAPVFGRPLEAETVYYKMVTVLASHGTFTFLVHISLPVQFPKLQPTLALQSTQHNDMQNRPISKAYDGFPWSPRWDPEEMVSRICDFIADEKTIGTFKSYCYEKLN